MILFIALSFPGCHNSDREKPSTPEKFAKLIINYKFRLDSAGLKSLLSEKCKDNPFDQFNFLKNNFIDEYNIKNVNFADDKAHDFSGINCKIINETKNIINLECSGIYKINNESGKVVQSTNLIEMVELMREKGSLVLLPNSCK